ncbi:nucleotidyltransferase family protein [Nodosilinea nodulosa]|uniref:nucleotidyltransferase family protein n=1 Tax=Nodosilinea nodulosa TaxID=416001 RepID=UPI000313F81E|nr:nucleotidyltransferase family protein [Nodosilinea nodulosa]
MATQAASAINKADVLAQLRALKADLAKRYAVGQIGIFGSVARDQAGEDSDLDIVVHMQPDMLKRACLKAELEETFGRKVDVVRYWYGMNPYLKTRIDRDALYA